ncbi:MAG TPA: hypothetical protein VN416_02220, partial [Desulfomonilia bacterium]|nr:hypothetical protein [Desulfomonilia bacterium]
MVDDRRPMRGPTAPHEQDGDAPASGTAVPCQTRCPDDFGIDAPCRIVKAGGGTVQMSAREPEGFTGGNYTWLTESRKIRLSNVYSPTVTVEGLDEPSDGRDAETISVVRNAPGCQRIEKTVQVTVARLRFTESPNQRYGFDDNDSPDDHNDDHICVKKSDHTFVRVEIEGGLVGTDFDFASDSRRVCRPGDPEGSATFDLRLNAGSR